MDRLDGRPARRDVLGVGTGVLAVGLAGCVGGGVSENGDVATSPTNGTSTPSTTADSPQSGALALAADAFADGEAIPRRLTCDGENVSPRLSVMGVPDATASLAIVVDDPDAPGRTFTHWLLWDIPPETATIPSSVPHGSRVAALDGAAQGTNDAGHVGYDGPCPPGGDGPHTYRFRLLALKSTLPLDAGAKRAAFDDAVTGIVREDTVLRGTYAR